MKAKTYVLDDLVVCVLRDGFTAVEQTMMESGEPGRVIEMRREFQQIEPDITVEVFSSTRRSRDSAPPSFVCRGGWTASTKRAGQPGGGLAGGSRSRSARIV